MLWDGDADIEPNPEHLPNTNLLNRKHNIYCLKKNNKTKKLFFQDHLFLENVVKEYLSKIV